MTQAEAAARRAKHAGSVSHGQHDQLVLPPATLSPVSCLAIVAAAFNPQRSQRRESNLARFRDHVTAMGLPLAIVVGSGSAVGSSREIAGSVTTWTVPCRHVLWQKERLLNFAIERLPDEVDAVGWWDADLLFDRPDLPEAILDALGRWPVIQPWSHCRMLREDEASEQTWVTGNPIRSLAAANRGLPGEANPGAKHPGFAWCARRDTLAAIGGLYDRHITGGGDTAMALGFYGDLSSSFLRYDRMSQQSMRHWRAWANRAYAIVRGRVGCVPGVIRHLYHGEIRDRQYRLRWTRLASAKFDPGAHLRVSPAGCLEWTPQTPPSLREMVASYLLHERREP